MYSSFTEQLFILSCFVFVARRPLPFEACFSIWSNFRELSESLNPDHIYYPPENFYSNIQPNKPSQPTVARSFSKKKKDKKPIGDNQSSKSSSSSVQKCNCKCPSLPRTLCKRVVYFNFTLRMFSFSNQNSFLRNQKRFSFT